MHSVSRLVRRLKSSGRLVCALLRHRQSVCKQLSPPKLGGTDRNVSHHFSWRHCRVLDISGRATAEQADKSIFLILLRLLMLSGKLVSCLHCSIHRSRRHARLPMSPGRLVSPQLKTKIPRSFFQLPILCGNCFNSGQSMMTSFYKLLRLLRLFGSKVSSRISNRSSFCRLRRPQKLSASPPMPKNSSDPMFSGCSGD